MLMRTKKNNIQKTLFAACLTLVAVSGVRSETRIDNQQVKETSAYHSKGLEYFNAGQYEDAIEMWKKEIEENPKSAWAHYDIGIAYERLQNYEEAFTWKKKAIDIEPKTGRFYWGAGVNLGQMGKHQEAIEYFEKALTSGYQTAETYGWLAYSQHHIDSTAKGINIVKENLIKALVINPDYDFARSLLKQITSENEFEETIARINKERGGRLGKVYQENLPQVPFFFKYAYPLAILSGLLILVIITHFKLWHLYHLYAGNRAFSKDKYAEALYCYEKLLSVRDGKFVPYNKLRQIYLKTKRKDEKAIYVFEKIYKENPEDREVIAALAEAYAEKTK